MNSFHTAGAGWDYRFKASSPIIGLKMSENNIQTKITHPMVLRAKYSQICRNEEGGMKMPLSVIFT